ncbi:PTS sugar transporter subunit IIA [uncultured Megasphaera sp.]|uniref:PTS sugar transporter subunit IIA n=1 Tax=uncultured Megasphaera sp. TaxID=165188 RepID=UPI0026342364|nr:PTS sugar transporter subunit IIA [uncultured Megasphaera sp.]
MATLRFLVAHGTADTAEEAIRICGKVLRQAGVVSDSFIEKCVKREKEFPTGLPTDIPTAIPHCKDDSITENCICFLKLAHPVTFRRMDDDTETIQTDMIFNLAICDPNEHIDVLTNMMAFLGDTDSLQKCRILPDDQVITYLQAHLVPPDGETAQEA